MKPFFHIKFTDGTVFEAPTSVVANDRAACYHDLKADEFPTLDAALKDTTELFTSDPYQIEDWAKSNMNWADIRPHAVLIGYEPAERDWDSSEVSFHDESTPPKVPAAGESMMGLPLELAILRILAGNHVCAFMPLGPSDKPLGSLVVIQGGSAITKYFLGGIRRLTEQLAASRPVPETQTTN